MAKVYYTLSTYDYSKINVVKIHKLQISLQCRRGGDREMLITAAFCPSKLKQQFPEHQLLPFFLSLPRCLNLSAARLSSIYLPANKNKERYPAKS